jgi:hypothetical protein
MREELIKFKKWYDECSEAYRNALLDEEIIDHYLSQKPKEEYPKPCDCEKPDPFSGTCLLCGLKVKPAELKKEEHNCANNVSLVSATLGTCKVCGEIVDLLDH